MRTLVHGILVVAICTGSGLAAGAEEPPSGDWLGHVAEQIERSEYFFSESSDGMLQAPNRAQGLRTYAGESGFSVVSRTGGEREFRVGLSLESWGRRGNLAGFEPGYVRSEEQRLVLDRLDLLEWLVNEPEGIEHGFTLPAPPRDGGGPVVLRLRIETALQATPDGPRSVIFEDPSGRPVLHYRGLRVFDAVGIDLDARLNVGPGVIEIEFDDTGAVYPVTVDPVMTTAAWIRDGNQASAAVFGRSVATAGDVNGDGYSDLIVGASTYDNGETDEGRVFLYYGSDSGLSTSVAWTAEGNQAGAWFGADVAPAGDVNDDGYDDVVIGASNYSNGQTGEGRAFVYHGSATGPPATPAWTAEPNQAGSTFGNAVGTAGDVNNDGYADVIIGAFLHDGAFGNDGRVWVYHGSATGLSATPARVLAINQGNAQFGFAVSTAGDVNGDGYDDILLGAAGYTNGQSFEGRAFVYLGSASGVATSPVWAEESNQNFASFGSAVSTAGDVNGDGYADILVGANGWDSTLNDVGRVSIFFGSSSGPSTSADQTITGIQATARLGYDVATAGDVNGDGFADIVVSAYQHTNGETGEGRAYVYKGTSLGVSLAPYWTGEGNQASAQYGNSVGTAGDVNGDGYSDIVIGAHFYDAGQTNEGRAYVYYGGGDGLRSGHSSSRGSGQADAELGYSVSTAGDVNGDGFSDIIVGVPYYDAGSTNEGRAYAYYGSATGIAASPSWSVEGNQSNAEFGRSVAWAGDVDNDGYDDVLVGAPRYDAGSVNEGRAFLFRGGSSGLSTSSSWNAETNQSSDEFGHVVAGAGDVNGDGFADVLVGAPLAGPSNDGRVNLYLGSATAPSATPDWSFTGNGQANANVGYSVATAGDVNRDGLADVIIGAPGYTDGESGEGHAWIYLGSAASGLEGTPFYTGQPNQAGAAYGTAVATAGDVNGDGYSDVVISAPGYDDDQVDEGFVVVLRGTPGGMVFQFNVFGNISGTDLGRSVGTAGDVNGDGYSDVVIGDPGRNPGYVTVWYGSASGFPASPSWSKSGTLGSTDLRLGWSVGTAGDVNGDGFSDMLIGAPRNGFATGTTGEGYVYLYYGGDGDGLDRIPRQQQPAGTGAPRLSRQGKSSGTNSVRIRSRARVASGRGRVQVEYEVKPLEVPFDGTGTVFSSELMMSPPASDGSRTNYSSPISGLTGGPDYHWRLRFRSPNPFFRFSRWFSLPAIGPAEEGFMTSCTVQTWHRDQDSDGFGDSSVTSSSCTQPGGYVADGTDCDDTDDSINPGATELLCDGVDNDCDPGTPDAPDTDSDGLDVCDPADPGDSDGLGGDNCSDVANPGQEDGDSDGWGDPCDLCPGATDDLDSDGFQGPCVAESGWSLNRIIDFPEPTGAHYNPVDGKIYTCLRSGSSRGLYRIEDNGSSTALWSGDWCAAAVVDPDDGDVFATDDYSGEIWRTAFGQTGRATWVFGMHSGDDDPIGMAIAPAGYTGSVVAPGEAIVVDRGSNNADEIWRWDPATAEGETVIHADNGTLVDATDVAFTPSRVFVTDSGSTSDGMIYEVLPGGGLSELVTTEVLAEPTGIAYDPIDGDLLVLERGVNGGNRRLARVDPVTGHVSEVIRGLGGPLYSGIDVWPAGGWIVVSDHDSGRIYEFVRDADSDGIDDSADCRPYDPNVTDQLPEVSNLVISHTGGEAGATILNWDETFENYDVIRSVDPADFVTSAVCIKEGEPVATATDSTIPAAGTFFFYLVGAENDRCGRGSLGTDSDGVERVGTVCP